MELCYRLIFFFPICSESFSLITTMAKFKILTSPERCHKNFSLKICYHFIPQQQTPAALLSVLVTYCCMRKTTFKKKKISLLTLAKTFPYAGFCSCISPTTGSFFSVELLSQHTVFSNLPSQELISVL